MDWAINAYAKLSGLGAYIMDLLPLIGGVGSLLAIAGAIALRVSVATNPAEALHALHPTLTEAAAASLAFGAIKAHFNHIANVAKIDEHAAKLATPDPALAKPSA